MEDFDIFKEIFSTSPKSCKPKEYYNVVLASDKLEFLKTFLKEQKSKLDRAFQRCESDDDYTSMDIASILEALDSAALM